MALYTEARISTKRLDPFHVAVVRNRIDRRMILEQFGRRDKEPW
jgi:hypothetical protein